MVKRLVHVCPPSVECHQGALLPHEPLKAVITISLGLAGLIAMLGSWSPNVSLALRVKSVLLTTTSAIKVTAARPFTPGRRSSGTRSRQYGVRSLGELEKDERLL